MIFNDIKKEENKFVEDDRNRTVKLHGPERSMEETVSTLHSVLEADKWNVGHQKPPPSQKMKTIP